MSYLKKLTLCLLFVALFTPLSSAFSGTWQVIPIRLDFDQRTRSGVITIKNNSDEKISFSVEARQWSQEADGKDIYSETSDILFFPKMLNIEPHKERIIRAGIKVPALNKEKTFRLFIKQESAPEKRKGSNVAIAIRFGVPMFATPREEKISGEITATVFEEDSVLVGIKNSGNTHFRVSTIQLSGTNSAGKETYKQTLSGNYLLAGTERTFAAPLPHDVCRQLKTIDIQVASDRIQLDRKINVDKAMCPTP